MNTYDESADKRVGNYLKQVLGNDKNDTRITPELAEFLKCDASELKNHMDVVCSIVSYINKNNLKNYDKNGEFILDATLAKLFHKPPGTTLLFQNMRDYLAHYCYVF